MRRPEQIVGGALRRFVACSLLAFLVFGAGSILLAHHIASEEATRDAVLEASALARGAVAPLAGEGLRAEHGAPARSLSTVLAGYLGDGPAQHIALVGPGGRVLWADGGPAAPAVVEITPWARSVLESRGAQVGPPLSKASAPGSAELADVYVGVTDATGRPLLVVATMPVPVRAHQWHLVEELIPLALAGMVAFALTSGWLAVSLARRVEGGLRRQAVLERKAFLAADLERRRLARDLHDGVIQELAAFEVGGEDGLALQDLSLIHI